MTHDVVERVVGVVALSEGGAGGDEHSGQADLEHEQHADQPHHPDRGLGHGGSAVLGFLVERGDRIEADEAQCSDRHRATTSAHEDCRGDEDVERQVGVAEKIRTVAQPTKTARTASWMHRKILFIGPSR